MKFLARRSFLGGCLALPALPALAQPAKSRLILLGTGGGPRPSPTRAASSQVIIVNGAAYVVDCGDGVARQLTLAQVPLTSHPQRLHHSSAQRPPPTMAMCCG